MELNKKWCVWTVFSSLAILIIIAGVIAIVDPFFHYHKPLEQLSYRLGNQSYINPGIVRQFEYDTLIAGTSMTENFKPSYFKEVLGANAVKVPYPGGRSKNMSIIIDMALKSNPNLKTVYLGLDMSMMKYDIEATRSPLPEYLYDTNFFNDINYLLNKDVLLERVAYNIVMTINGEASTTFDEYSYWQDKHTISQYAVMDANWGIEMEDSTNMTLDETLSLSYDNLRENILPLIEAYPDIKFVIFYPPYSILFWYRNYADHELRILEHSIKALLPYENVELFLFLNESALVTNLYNYRDTRHYNADANMYMVDCFKNGTHRLTSENYEAELEQLSTLVNSFDYGLLFGESNPFILESNYLRYLSKLNDSRYITFFVTRMNTPVSSYDILGNQYLTLGLDNSKSNFGYAAIIDDQNAIFQESSDDAILFNGTVDGMSVSLVSETRKGKNYIEVIIDGVKYTTNQAGVNIVVYDKVLARVMDNIAVNIEDGSITRN